MPRNFRVKPTIHPTSFDVGWTAGIVDGEGAVSLGKTQRSDGKHAYYIYVKVTNTDPRILYRLQGFWGGTVNPKAGKIKEGCRQPWYWSVYGDQARELLRLTAPHLTSKREQAEIVLEYEGGYEYSGALLPEAELARREDIRERLSVLRRREWLVSSQEEAV